MENRKNIALLIRDFNVVGGIERVACSLSNEFSKMYNLYVVVFCDKNKVFNISGTIINLNTEELRPSWFWKLPLKVDKVLKLRNIIRKYKISTVISFGEYANVLNVISRVNNKSILTIHSLKSKEEKENSFLKGLKNTLFIKYLYGRSDKIITVSKYSGIDLIENFKLPANIISPIYNPFSNTDIEQLSNLELDTEYQKKEGERVIISVGRICKTKAFHFLINSFSIVSKKIKNVKLQILGEALLGEEKKIKKELLMQIERLNIKGKVQFIDFQKNPYKFIKNANILTSSTILEGFGNTIVEAFICGTPVIFPDCKAGPREIISPGTDIKTEIKEPEYAEFGVLVPDFNGDPSLYSKKEGMLASAIIKLLEDEELSSEYVRAEE